MPHNTSKWSSEEHTQTPLPTRIRELALALALIISSWQSLLDENPLRLGEKAVACTNGKPAVSESSSACFGGASYTNRHYIFLLLNIVDPDHAQRAQLMISYGSSCGFSVHWGNSLLRFSSACVGSCAEPSRVPLSTGDLLSCRVESKLLLQK